MRSLTRCSGGTNIGGSSGRTTSSPRSPGDGPFVRGGGLAGTGGLSVDSDYSGRPLPELTKADVRRATDSLGEDPVGEILQLSDGTRGVVCARRLV